MKTRQKRKIYMHGVLNFLNKEEKNNQKNYAWGPLDHPHDTQALKCIY